MGYFKAIDLVEKEKLGWFHPEVKEEKAEETKEAQGMEKVTEVRKMAEDFLAEIEADKLAKINRELETAALEEREELNPDPQEELEDRYEYEAAKAEIAADLALAHKVRYKDLFGAYMRHICRIPTVEGYRKANIGDNPPIAELEARYGAQVDREKAEKRITEIYARLVEELAEEVK